MSELHPLHMLCGGSWPYRFKFLLRTKIVVPPIPYKKCYLIAIIDDKYQKTIMSLCDTGFNILFGVKQASNSTFTTGYPITNWREGRNDIFYILWHFFSRKYMPILISNLTFIKKKWEIWKITRIAKKWT